MPDDNAKPRNISESQNFHNFTQLWATASIGILTAFLVWGATRPDARSKIISTILAFLLAASFVCSALCMLLSAKLCVRTPGQGIVGSENAGPERHFFCVSMLIGWAALLAAVAFMLLLFNCPPDTGPRTDQSGRAGETQALHPFDPTSWAFWLLALSGAIFGVVTGLFGIGAGWLVVPWMTVLFRVHLTTAVGISAGYIVGTTSIRLLLTCIQSRLRGDWCPFFEGKNRRVVVLMVVFLAVGVISSTLIHTLIINKMPEVAMGKLGSGGIWILCTLLVFLVCLAIAVFFSAMLTWHVRGDNSTDGGTQAVLARAYTMFFEWCGFAGPTSTAQRADGESRSRSKAVLIALLSFVAGFMAGIWGIGGGLVLYPLLRLLLNEKHADAANYASILVLVTAMVMSFVHVVTGNMDLTYVLPLVAGGGASVATSMLALESRLKEGFARGPGLMAFGCVVLVAIALTVRKIVE